ncbi:MAG: hypothetical protein IJS71_03165 [Clostridia bacterium]|nr:hypothetical protein [Clostridia bacterium]
MKFRNLITNILYVVILFALVGFLLVEFQVFGFDDGIKRVVATVFLLLAVIGVSVIEIVLPIVANRDMLRNKKFIIKALVKTVLFLAASIVLFLYEPFGVIKDVVLALVLFVVFYFLQFFINLEPQRVKKSAKKAREMSPAAERRRAELESEEKAAEENENK